MDSVFLDFPLLFCVSSPRLHFLASAIVENKRDTMSYTQSKLQIKLEDNVYVRLVWHSGNNYTAVYRARWDLKRVENFSWKIGTFTMIGKLCILKYIRVPSWTCGCRWDENGGSPCVNTVFYHVFVYTTSWFHRGSADVNGRSLPSSRVNLHLSAGPMNYERYRPAPSEALAAVPADTRALGEWIRYSMSPNGIIFYPTWEQNGIIEVLILLVR